MTFTNTNTKTNTQTKTNIKCFKDPMYVMFLKRRGFNDFKYHMHMDMGDMDVMDMDVMDMDVMDMDIVDMLYIFNCILLYSKWDRVMTGHGHFSYKMI